MKSVEEQLQVILRGVERTVTEEELKKKLARSISAGKPLRVKYGIDYFGADGQFVRAVQNGFNLVHYTRKHASRFTRPAAAGAAGALGAGACADCHTPEDLAYGFVSSDRFDPELGKRISFEDSVRRCYARSMNGYAPTIYDPAVRDIMARRVTRLAEYECDGVPPSSLTGYAADTGFDLTVEDALDYARWLAERLHAAGMSAGLAGPQALTGELWPTFDFGFAIGCMEGSQCSAFEVFEQARKPVLHVEFGDEGSAPDICNAASSLGFIPLITDPGFSGETVLCRDIL